MVGSAYYLGQGLPKDPAEAVRWYRKAADQGNADAQFNLGVAHEVFKGYRLDDNSRGPLEDDVESVEWFRKAADQGRADAQYKVGDAYKYGYGVAKDSVEAVKWFHRAARQGEDLAQMALVGAYLAGEGTAKDPVEAYAWINLVAVTNPSAVTWRDQLAEDMSPQQIADGQARSTSLQREIDTRKTAR